MRNCALRPQGLWKHQRATYLDMSQAILDQCNDHHATMPQCHLAAGRILSYMPPRVVFFIPPVMVGVNLLKCQVRAPVAQWIRVAGFEPVGRKFESCRVYHEIIISYVIMRICQNSNLKGL
jgi:hypothetical protein